jgi:tetratricopeptide (TPR) repeat protein
MAEMRHDKLFEQPDECHLGECPICCLPMPLGVDKWSTNSCCCKRLCNGCTYANAIREIEAGLEQRCAFCREPMPRSKEEVNHNSVVRAEANDPVALTDLGRKCDVEGDYEGAFEYYAKAAKLGDTEAHHFLYSMYRKGDGVEKNEKKATYHLEEAAIGGHAEARYKLGVDEWKSGRNDRAVKHWIIAAKLGYDDALETVKGGFAAGFVTKEDYEAALRGHQAAVDATKSKQREKAEEVVKSGELRRA